MTQATTTPTKRCERIIDTVREGDARWGEPIAHLECGEPTNCGDVVCCHECPAHEAERDEYLAWEDEQINGPARRDRERQAREDAIEARAASAGWRAVEAGWRATESRSERTLRRARGA